MPYPQDPFALKLKTAFSCPSCKKRPMVRETKDQQSKFMGQVRCEKCGYISDVESLRTSLRESRSR